MGKGSTSLGSTMLEKKVRNQKRQFSVFNTVAKPVSENEVLD